MGNRPTRREAVMDWLLEDEQPAIRYLVLTQLVGSPQTDPEVQSARKAIPVRGWAADILARQEWGGVGLRREPVPIHASNRGGMVLEKALFLRIVDTRPLFRAAAQ